MSEERVIKKVAIVGAGGIGSNFASLFFRYGVLPREQYPFTDWEVQIWDKDTVDASNLLHQDYTQEELGQSKADIIANRCVMTAVNEFMTEKDFEKFDVIFCGVDSMTFRKSLYEWGWAHPKSTLFWIDGRCTSKQGLVLNSTVPKATLQKYLNDSTERTGCLLSHEKVKRVSHATPIVVAGYMLQLFLNWYRGADKIPVHGPFII